MRQLYKISPVQSSAFADELLEASTFNYCPPLDRNTRTELTGLSREEMDKFLPNVINVSPNSPDFLAKVEDYYREFSEEIPFRGKELDITLDDKTGLPIKPTDYLLYRIVMLDKVVAKGEDVKSADGKFFYYKLESLTELQEQQESAYSVEKDAVVAFTKLTQTEDTPQQTRILKSIVLLYRQSLNLGIDEVNGASRITTEIHLKKILEKNPKAIVDAYADKDITIKAQIELFLDFGLVNMEGDEIFYEGSKLSNNKTSLIGVLRSNNTVFASLLAKLRKESHLVNTLIKEQVEDKV